MKGSVRPLQRGTFTPPRFTGKPPIYGKARIFPEGPDVPGRPRFTRKAPIYPEGADLRGRPRSTRKAPMYGFTQFSVKAPFYGEGPLFGEGPVCGEGPCYRGLPLDPPKSKSLNPKP